MDPRDLLRPSVARVEPYHALEPLEAAAAQRGLSPNRILRLNANENPYGTPLRVQEALASFDQYHLYPDPESREIRALLANYTGIEARQIIVGNGSDEIIDLLFWLFVEPGEAVMIPTPTFGMYQARAAVFGARVAAVPRRADFSLDSEAMEAALMPDVKLVFLASPNNPSGNLCRERDIVRLLRRNVIVVVDEAYFEFSGRTVAPLIGEFDNLVVLRTFSKWAGLAGLRVGYGLMPRWIADEAWRIKQPYNVNVAAQVAVRAIFDDLAYFRSTIRRIRLERLRMYRALRKLNFVKPLESKANYLLVHVRHGGSAALQEWLEEDGIFVRRYSSPDLAEYVRISVGRPEDTDRMMRRMTILAQRYAREIGRTED
ncbi:MAG: histidinol-phosphate transaminase [Thermomicrobia bacterium]|nr:histidinol-phosphate transaminase [Thermomicrobia bacterium]MCA1723372.1 histidinol-phosphate transaminase [Thermomicrobia bacterium]